MPIILQKKGKKEWMQVKAAILKKCKGEVYNSELVNGINIFEEAISWKWNMDLCIIIPLKAES